MVKLIYDLFMEGTLTVMAGIKAFGMWETEKLDGNPYAKKGSVKVFLDEPKIPLILDTYEDRIAFIAVRVASSDRFILPKSNRTEEETKRAEYFAIYTPSEEWEIVDGAYSPIAGSQAEALVKELIPREEIVTDPAQRESANLDMEALRNVIAQSMDLPPYDSFPLTQRQMLEQAAYRMDMKIEEYIESQIPPKRQQWAYARFGIDVPATT
jgi:hypothetical protein